jgi:hypothetical protein
MSQRLAQKRTRIEESEWELVRELMPRRKGTCGLQYVALEYLYDHLYEKVSEEELREHFLAVRGQLQVKGDPVKSAINLAIKELQRLNERSFELIKIQEASLVGKTRRYVQLNYTGSDAVIGFAAFQSYLNDVLAEEELPILRSIFNIYPGIEPTIFPGVQKRWLDKIQAFALVSSASQIDPENQKTSYFLIPESSCNHGFLLLYESEKSSLPFLAFVTDISSVDSLEESKYVIYRGGEKVDRLQFYHQIWMRQYQTALTREETAALLNQAAEAAASSRLVDEAAMRKGLIALKVREKWERLLRQKDEMQNAINAS